MARYHISSRTGNPGLCRAEFQCPFGDIESEHYNSKEEAREAFERAQSNRALQGKKSGVVPLPDYLTSELVAQIPVGENGLTFEENWEKTFRILGMPSVDLPNVAALKQLGLEGIDAATDVQRVDLDCFDPHRDGIGAALSELYHPKDETIEGWDLPLVVVLTSDGPLEISGHGELLHEWKDDLDPDQTGYMLRLDETREMTEAIENEDLTTARANARLLYERIANRETSPLVVMPRNSETVKKNSLINREIANLRTEYKQRMHAYTGHKFTMASPAERDRLRAILDTPYESWSDNEVKEYVSITGDNEGLLRERLQHVKEDKAKADLCDRAITDIQSGGASPAVLELLGGEERVKDMRSIANRNYETWSKPFREQKKVLGWMSAYSKKVSKLEKESGVLIDAAHWPGDPKRMPQEFKPKL